jgi:hypothetical protein
MTTTPEPTLRDKAGQLLTLTVEQNERVLAAAGFNHAAIEAEAAARPVAPADNRPPAVTKFQPENGIENRTAQLRAMH